MQILFPFTKFPNVLTHFVPSLCILVNIFMNMKLLYNQPSEVYPFKVTHLVDSLIYHTEQRGWVRLIRTFSFVWVCPYLYYEPSKPCACLYLSWTPGPWACQPWTRNMKFAFFNEHPGIYWWFQFPIWAAATFGTTKTDNPCGDCHPFLFSVNFIKKICHWNRMGLNDSQLCTEKRTTNRNKTATQPLGFLYCLSALQLS